MKRMRFRIASVMLLAACPWLCLAALVAGEYEPSGMMSLSDWWHMFKNGEIG